MRGAQGRAGSETTGGGGEGLARSKEGRQALRRAAARQAEPSSEEQGASWESPATLEWFWGVGSTRGKFSRRQRSSQQESKGTGVLVGKNMAFRARQTLI